MASMRRVLTVILAGAFVLPLVSCDKLTQLTGKKVEEVSPQDQKMKELEAKVQQMEAEAKARKEAEEKAKAEEELRAKIAAEVKAQTETQAAAPATQPATPPAAVTPAPAPTKVVERVIVKEVPAKPKAEAAPSAAAAATPTKASGYVRLYDDAGFTDRILTVRFGRDIGNMHYISSDDGKSGFNDKASSVMWSVPPGWQAVLYENDNYSKRGYVLKGSGSVPDLGYFGDKCSSIRWEKTAE
jgi:hypothetical protein